MQIGIERHAPCFPAKAAIKRARDVGFGSPGIFVPVCSVHGRRRSAAPRRATRGCAQAADLTDAGTLSALVAGSDVVLSVCPPHAALQVAHAVAATGFAGVYVDANAVAPATARTIGVAVEGAGGRFVDGDLIGGDGGGGHLQLCGQPVDRQAGGLPGELPGPQAQWAHRHHRRGRRGPALPHRPGRAGAWVGCIAGALSKGEYEAGLAAAGFTDIHVAFTHQVGDGLHSAVIRATRPVGAASASTATDPVARTTLPMASDPACC